MSMEAFVLSDRALGSIEEWQAAIDAEGFGLRLETMQAMAALRGHLPARWSGREAGFECGHGSLEELASTYPDSGFGRDWKHVLCFYWGTLPGCVGAYMAASAYARATGGLIFDPQDDKLLTAEEACKVARETEAVAPQIEAELAESARRRAERR